MPCGLALEPAGVASQVSPSCRGAEAVWWGAAELTVPSRRPARDAEEEPRAGLRRLLCAHFGGTWQSWGAAGSDTAASAGVGMGARGGGHISNKLMGDAAAAGLQTVLHRAGAVTWTWSSQVQDDLLGPSQALGVKEKERQSVCFTRPCC